MTANDTQNEEPLIVQDNGHIRHLILNRPHKLNAIDLAQHERLMEAFLEAERASKVRVLTLSGMGRAFCAGDDLTASKPRSNERHAKRNVDMEMGQGPSFLLETCATLYHLKKPTVALMHGVALGSGYDYSLSCDFRLVTPDIRYGDPRIDRALWAAEGWSYKLPRLIQQSLVAPVAYLGRLMDGATAMRYGLVHRIISPEPDIRTSAMPFLSRLSQIDDKTYRTTKASITMAVDSTFNQTQAFHAGL